MPTRFDTESRIAVTQAIDIAREMGHREVGPGHLLLGLLANPRGTAYAALREHGVHLDAARDLVATHHVDPEPSPAESESGETSGYDDDREALKAVGIDLDRVREAVRANLGADLADGWADRTDRTDRERGRGRGRRAGRRGHHHHHHEGRGRRGPRSRREEPRFSRELRAVLREVRRSTLRDRDDRMTGARLLVALIRTDDPAAQAVLAASTGLDGLRTQAEAAV